MKDSIPNLSPISQPNYQTLEGPFSAVSSPIFATKYSFCSSFRDLQDLQSFAPLRSQNFSAEFRWLFFFGSFELFLGTLLEGTTGVRALIGLAPRAAVCYEKDSERIRQFFRLFAKQGCFYSTLCKNHYFSTCFSEFWTDSDEKFSEIR